jgi:arsenate reductase
MITKVSLFNNLRNTCKQLSLENEIKISDEKKEILKEIANYIIESRKIRPSVRVMFVCTHNSRRSQIAQASIRAAAAFKGIGGIFSYSAGTEVTEVNPYTAEALKNIGFEVRKYDALENPKYAIAYSAEVPASIHYSKLINDISNPQYGFLAVMVCGSADMQCPTVTGSDKRILLAYDDIIAKSPEDSAEKHTQMAKQILTDMLFIMDLVEASVGAIA